MKYSIKNSTQNRFWIDAFTPAGKIGQFRTVGSFLERQHDNHAQIVQNTSYDKEGIKIQLPTPKEVANTFIAVLCAWLTSEEMQLIKEKQKNSTDPAVCYTHDYCDANLAMDQALNLHGIEVNIQSDAHVNLMNNSWSLAKKHNFEFITS